MPIKLRLFNFDSNIEKPEEGYVYFGFNDDFVLQYMNSDGIVNNIIKDNKEQSFDNVAIGNYLTLGTRDTTADYGTNSISFGTANVATGTATLAQGKNVYAIGNYSIASGEFVEANGLNSFAKGNGKGTTQKIYANSDFSFVFQGGVGGVQADVKADSNNNADYSVILGGLNTYIHDSSKSIILSSSNSYIVGKSDYGAIISSIDSSITNATNSFIIGGKNNDITYSVYTTPYASIIGGVENTIKDGVYVNVIGGKNNTISGGENNIIIGGSGNSITKINTSDVVYIGVNSVLDTNDTFDPTNTSQKLDYSDYVYVPRIRFLKTAAMGLNYSIPEGSIFYSTTNNDLEAYVNQGGSDGLGLKRYSITGRSKADIDASNVNTKGHASAFRSNIDVYSTSQTVYAGAYETASLTFNSFNKHSFIGTVLVTGNNKINADKTPFGNERLEWYSVINARHRNGLLDGDSYGLQIASGLNYFKEQIAFRTQSNGSWTDWKELATTDRFMPMRKDISTDFFEWSFEEVATNKGRMNLTIGDDCNDINGLETFVIRNSQTSFITKFNSNRITEIYNLYIGDGVGYVYGHNNYRYSFLEIGTQTKPDEYINGSLYIGAKPNSMRIYADGVTTDIGDDSKTLDTTLRVLSGLNKTSGVEVYGQGQGDGYIYVGQESAHGGGIVYRGDTSSDNTLFSGFIEDRITFYRRDANINHSVMWYAYLSDTVNFNGGVNVNAVSTITAYNNQVLNIVGTSVTEASISYKGTGGQQWVAGASTNAIADSFGIWSGTAKTNVATFYSNGNVKIAAALDVVDKVNTRNNLGVYSKGEGDLRYLKLKTDTGNDYFEWSFANDGVVDTITEGNKGRMYLTMGDDNDGSQAFIIKGIKNTTASFFSNGSSELHGDVYLHDNIYNLTYKYKAFSFGESELNINQDNEFSIVRINGLTEANGGIRIGDNTDCYLLLGDYGSIETKSSLSVTGASNLKGGVTTSKLSVNGNININADLNTWSGAKYTAIYGSSADRYTHILFPHVPYLLNGYRGHGGSSFGAIMRFEGLEGDNRSTMPWDIGMVDSLGGDKFGIKRNNADLLTLTNAGTLTVGDPAGTRANLDVYSKGEGDLRYLKLKTDIGSDNFEWSFGDDGVVNTITEGNMGRMYLTMGDDNDGSQAFVIKGTSYTTATFYSNGQSEISGTIFSGGNIYGSGWKLAFELSKDKDTWLRVNSENHYSSGVYFASSTVRTDGRLEVGNAGSSFSVDSSGNVNASGNMYINSFGFVNQQTGNIKKTYGNLYTYSTYPTHSPVGAFDYGETIGFGYQGWAEISAQWVNNDTKLKVRVKSDTLEWGNWCDIYGSFNTVPVSNGGTGATTEADARKNLDVYSKGEGDLRYMKLLNPSGSDAINWEITNDDGGNAERLYLNINDDGDDFFRIRGKIGETTYNTATFYADGHTDLHGNVTIGGTMSVAGGNFAVDDKGNLSVYGNISATSGDLHGTNLTLSNALPIAQGGTGATTILGARSALSVYSKDETYTRTETEQKIKDKVQNADYIYTELFLYVETASNNKPSNVGFLDVDNYNCFTINPCKNWQSKSCNHVKLPPASSTYGGRAIIIANLAGSSDTIHVVTDDKHIPIASDDVLTFVCLRTDLVTYKWGTFAAFSDNYID